MATTEIRQMGGPRPVPDVHRLDVVPRRVGRAARPPTLGDTLNEVMRQRSHTTEAAAKAMDVASDLVLAWSADERLSDRKSDAALMEYLQVDDRQLRALVLRGQMRRTQARIRN